MASASIEMEMADLKRLRADLDLLRQETERTDVLMKEAAQRLVPLLTEPPRYLAIGRREHLDAILSLRDNPFKYGMEDVELTEPKLLFSSSLELEEGLEEGLEDLGYDIVVAKGVVEATPTLETFTQARGNNITVGQSFFEAEHTYLIAATEFGKRWAKEEVTVEEAADLDVLRDSQWAGNSIHILYRIDPQLKQRVQEFMKEKGIPVLTQDMFDTD